MSSAGFNTTCPGQREEQHAVVGVQVERRVDIDEIDALRRDALAQHVEVVAVVERVDPRHARPLKLSPLSGRYAPAPRSAAGSAR